MGRPWGTRRVRRTRALRCVAVPLPINSAAAMTSSLISSMKLDFPVVLEALRIRVVDELLRRGVGHRADAVHQ